MNIRIRIVNTVYTVILEDHAVCDERDVFGWCSDEDKTIHVDKTISAARFRETLWHEILHALYEEYKFPAGLKEERTVTWLGKALGDFIGANPKFVRKYLL